MKEQIMTFLQKHKAACMGFAMGLILGILYLTMGFWRTTLLAVCILIATLCGRCIDKGENPLLQFFLFVIKARDTIWGLFKK